MYEKFFGLRERPFSMVPDPSFLYLGDNHSAGLSMLRYGLMNRAGIIVLTGDIGAGKTTLVRQLISELGDDVVLGLIANTHPSFGNLMQWVAVAFGLDAGLESKANLFEQFVSFLIAQYAAGKRTILVVDEAQNLEPSVLEELRLLTNINADKDFVIQLVLVGQPELRATLRNRHLDQFVQRIGVDYHLSSLSAEDTGKYIAHRLAVAGASREIFSASACRFIHLQCKGVPRLINSVCDTSLVYAFAMQEAEISAELVFDMVMERIARGLFGVGWIEYPTGEENEVPSQEDLKTAISVAKRRASSNLRKARAYAAVS